MTEPSEAMRLWQELLIKAATAEGLPNPLPLFGADGLGGHETQTAILDYQARHGLASTGQFDQATRAALNPPTVDYSLGRSIGTGLLSFIINQALRGTGVTMDFAKISKAIAGGISGLLATTGTMAVIYFNLPPADVSHFPSFIYSIVPYVNEALGFAIGFSTVYFAPPNKG